MQRLRDIDSLRERIREEARLEDIVARYGVDLRRASNDSVKGLCPFHKEDTPSFGISTSKQVYNCFGCKANGDVFTFIQEMENVEHMDAVKKLAEMCSIPLGPYLADLTPEEERAARFYRANAEVLESYTDEIDWERFTAWRSKRQFSLEILAEYGIGYSSHEPEALDYIQLDEAIALEFVNNKAKWEDTIVVPLRDQYGRIAGFNNRLLNGGKVKTLSPTSKYPLPVPLFYGLYEARKYIREAGFLILVEGEPDVWQMAAHGYRNVAAMRGTKLTDDMLAVLAGLSINQVVVLADNDDPGRKFSRSVAYSRFGAKVMVKIARLRAQESDPDKVLLAEGKGPIDDAIAGAKYAFEYLIHSVCDEHGTSTPTQKLDVLNALKQRMGSAPEHEQSLAVKMLADVLSMDETVLTDFFRETEEATPAQLHSTKAERVVLKRMITDPAFIGEGLLGVRSSDFYLSKHKVIFDAISLLYRTQETVNPDTVRSYLIAKGKLTGDPLAGVLDSSVDASGADYLISEIRENAIRRDIARKSKDLANRLSDTSNDAKELIQKFSGDIAEAVVTNGSKVVEVGSVVHDRVKLMHDRLKNPNMIVGLDLGPDFHSLNFTLHGLQRKRYVVIAAPSGVGKTAMAGALARRVCVDLGEPGLYCTFETGIEALTDRLISSVSGVESDKIVTGHLTKEEVGHVHDAAALVGAAPLVITERGIIFEECASLIRHDVLKRGTRLVIVDYIQLMRLADSKNVRRDIELGIISRGFLELAHELDITIVVLAQQNREGVKAGNEKKESVGDSYKIAQDSDVFIVMREKTKEEVDADGPEKGNRFVMIDKHRHGKAGVGFHMLADLAVMRMMEVRTTFKPAPR